MPRKPRVEFPGAFYHVVARGNRRRPIFRDRADREEYLSRLEGYRKRHEFTVYAYVLMANHVHLLLETGPVPLSRIMQGLQYTYARYFNRKYGTVGHLFQGRYRALLCDRDAYLLELVRYIHLNPARTRRPEDPFAYVWSSHRAYVGKEIAVKVRVAAVLGQFHRSLGPARRAYEEYVRTGFSLGHQAKYYEAVDQRFLGDDRFVEEVDRVSGRTKEVRGEGPRVSYAVLLREVSREGGVEPGDMVGRGRGEREQRARALLCYLGREWSRMSVKELGNRLGRDPSMISRLCRAHESDRDEGAEQRLADRLRRRIQTHA